MGATQQGTTCCGPPLRKPCSGIAPLPSLAANPALPVKKSEERVFADQGDSETTAHIESNIQKKQKHDADGHGSGADIPGTKEATLVGVESHEPCVEEEELPEGATCEHRHETYRNRDGTLQVRCVHRHTYPQSSVEGGPVTIETASDLKPQDLSGGLLLSDQGICKSRDSNRQAVRRYRERKKHELQVCRIPWRIC